jgi:hypothetical protein
VQEPELFFHEEQEDHHGAPGTEKVLPALPETPAAQRNQVKWLDAPQSPRGLDPGA